MMSEPERQIRARAPRNRTLELSSQEIAKYREHIVYSGVKEPDAIICGDAYERLPLLSAGTLDLIFADPPYNLSKVFGKEKFISTTDEDYEKWLDSWVKLCVPLLKRCGSMYICGDWRSSAAIQRIGSRYLQCRNRITWEREKGRGAKANWKNASEDIWFFTVSDDHTFNVDAVKQRRRVLAPYKDKGVAKDWNEETGFRDTHPSNLWTDLTVPFWSMPENTYHPTQKPEKLLAKIILASTNAGGTILDPFAGSGTTAVVAKKLGRHFVAIEKDEQYCLLAAKRLELAEIDTSIQGFKDGVFWDRNSGQHRKQ